MTSQNFDAQDSRFAAEFAGDVTVERIAAVYAEAFLNVTEKSGETESAIAELDAIVDEVLKPHPRFAEILARTSFLTRRRLALSTASSKAEYHNWC